MFNKLYSYRFYTFFFSLIAILFGSLIFPNELFNSVLSPILFLINLLTGILLISKKRKLMWFFIFLLLFATFIFGFDFTEYENRKTVNFLRMAAYFLFYTMVTYEIIIQVWRAKEIGKNVFLGLISGYISLGLIGFFICLSIEMAYPNSFNGLTTINSNINELIDNLMYFSYITILSIGYGDISPITPIAKKASILIGLMGQIYLVVITSIVVGKYINQSSNPNNNNLK